MKISVNKTFICFPLVTPMRKNENGTFDSISEDKAELKSRLQDAVKLKITGIIRPKEDAASASPLRRWVIPRL